MSKIVENYLLKQLIGQGEFGEVYKAQHTQTDEFFAIKMLNFETFIKSPKLQELIINEVQSLKKISHKNVIKFYKLLKTNNHIYLVFEYCQNGSLEDILKKKQFLPEVEALELFKQIIDGFQIIHKYNIVHQDIKPTNILLGQNNDIKIADFGFCKILPQEEKQNNSSNNNSDSQAVFGSPIYMAPEVMQGAQPSKNQDIYALGVLFFEILYGFCPFEDSNFDNLLQKKLSLTPNFSNEINKSVSEQTKSLLMRMLNKIPEQRLDVNQIHRFLFQNDIQAITQNIIDFNISTNNNNGSSPTIHKNSTGSANYAFNSERDAIERISIKQEFGFDQLQNKPSPYSQSIKEQNIQFNNNDYQFQKNKPTSDKFDYLNKLMQKERNKIVYISNIMCAILDLNLNSASAKSIYLLLKKMLKESYKLSDFINSTDYLMIQQKFEIENLSDWFDFKQSQDFQFFHDIINQEQTEIRNNLRDFKIMIEKELPSAQLDTIQKELTSIEFMENDTVMRQQLENYMQSVKCVANEQIQNGNIELGKKILIHLNNVLDCVELEKFFNNFIDKKYVRIDEQPYFKVIGDFSYSVLNDLIEAKLKKSDTINFTYQ